MAFSFLISHSTRAIVTVREYSQKNLISQYFNSDKATRVEVLEGKEQNLYEKMGCVWMNSNIVIAHHVVVAVEFVIIVYVGAHYSIT